MTVPRERTRAVLQAARAMSDLLPYARRRERQRLAHVPVELIEEIAAALRHYPTVGDMQEAARACPRVFGRIVPAEADRWRLTDVAVD